LKQANDWTAVKFREYGLTNVHLEPWTIAHSWHEERHTRASCSDGASTDDRVSGLGLGTAESYGGSVAYVDIKTDEDFESIVGS